MARIQEYGKDAVPNDEDKLLGSEGAAGPNFGETKNYSIGTLKNYFAINGTPTGLEAIDEGGRNAYLSTGDPIGWRLIGRNPDNFGPIGEGAIDFSSGYSVDTTGFQSGATLTNSDKIGGTGPTSFTLNGNVENNSAGGVIFGSQNINNGGPNAEPTYFVGGVIAGQINESYGLNYHNFISGYRNTMGDRDASSWSGAGFPYPWPVQYYNAQIGLLNNMPAGYTSMQFGYGLLSSGDFCTTVGVANEDITQSVARNVTNYRNNYNPRFIVGCGTATGNTGINPGVGVRQNGFVVMSDGTATFPILTNVKIDAAGDDSAVTKGYVKNLKVADSAEVASATTEGKLRYTKTANSSSVEMVMQTGASTYEWVVIKQNTW